MNDFEGEVVGFRGRMGSAFTRFSAGRLAQVGRKDDIGVHSPANSPIFVCTGVDAIEHVIQRTPKERVEDLVIMQNGILRPVVAGHMATLGLGASSVTLAVLYFSVLERGGPAKGGGRSFVNGKWADSFRQLLERGGVECEVLQSEEELDARAAEKLIWTSSMWLMCHRNGKHTVTVEQVHSDQELSAILHSLVSEMVAVISLRLGVPPCGFRTGSGSTLLGQDVRGVVSRMADYSNRISGAVPSQRLALDELQLRNGWFFPPGGEMADEARQQQRLHLELLGLQGVTLGACGLSHAGQQ